MKDRHAPYVVLSFVLTNEMRFSSVLGLISVVIVLLHVPCAAKLVK